jgi:hypothetical protein
MQEIKNLEIQRLQYREHLKTAESDDEKIRLVALIENIGERINELLNKK